MPKILVNPREKILKESYKLLKEQGYESFSMRELALRCNIGLGTVYNYFKNKMAIVEELFNDKWKYTIEGIKESKECNRRYTMEELHIILDEIIEGTKNKGEISIEIDSRKLASFIMNNMVSIIMGKMELSIEEFIFIVTNKF